MTDPPLFFLVFLALFAVVFVGAVVLIIVSAVKRRRAVAAAGLDPFTADIQLAARVAQSAAFAPNQSLEQRLTELDDLRARDVITPEEYEQSRRGALGIG